MTRPIRTLAHDSGDGARVFHCAFCGGGQVVGRSDGTIECEYCGQCFTVQVQPMFSGYPQTVGGQPFPIPGMPGQIGGPPAADPGMGMDGAPGEADDGGNPFAQDPDAGADPAADAGDAPPFAEEQQDGGDPDDAPPPPPPGGKKKSKSSAVAPYRTASGARLSEEAFAEYLAVRHAGAAERGGLLERLHASRG